MESDAGLYFVNAVASPPTRVRVGFPAALLPRDLRSVSGLLGGVAIGFALDVDRYGTHLLGYPGVSRSEDGLEWTLVCSEHETVRILSGAP
jgi:hypothetical protein